MKEEHKYRRLSSRPVMTKPKFTTEGVCITPRDVVCLWIPVTVKPPSHIFFCDIHIDF